MNDFSCLDKFGKARILAVGEGAHFICEFWEMRRKLFKYFHEKHGFSVFAMEFGFAEGFELNKWINGESGDDDLEKYSATAAQWGAGDTVRWLRKYNENQETKIEFVGIDIPEAAGSLLPAFIPFAKYALKVEPFLEKELEQIIEIAGKIASPSSVTASIKWKELSENEQDKLTSGLNRILIRFQSLSHFYKQKNGQYNYLTAMRCLQAAVYVDYMIRAVANAGTPLALPLDMSVREYFMAQSVVWHLSYITKKADRKIMLFAHNNHIQKTEVAYGNYKVAQTMGYFLKQLYGNEYKAIAQTSSDNHTAEMEIDAALPFGFRVIDKPLEKPIENSFNAFIENNNHGNEITFTDLTDKNAPDFSSIRSQSAFVSTSVKNAFDGVINLPKISADENILNR
jgi:erythromycin esterase